MNCLFMGSKNVCVYVRVKSLLPVIYGKQNTRHKAEMANIARGKLNAILALRPSAECFMFRIARGRAMI